VDLLINQTQIRLVHQRGCLQGVVGPLATHIAMSQAVQFGIDERHQPVIRRLITVAPRQKQAGNL
jgi:hypothetical protein